SLVVWGRISDRMNERRWNLLAACVLSTAGLVLAGLTMGTWWALVGMSLAAMGFYGSEGPFFAMPPVFLSGTALAAGLPLDQLDRQSRRLLRAVVGRPHEGCDRQLFRRPLRARAAQPGIVGGLRPLPAHPRCDRAHRAAGCAGRLNQRRYLSKNALVRASA